MCVWSFAAMELFARGYNTSSPSRGTQAVLGNTVGRRASKLCVCTRRNISLLLSVQPRSLRSSELGDRNAVGVLSKTLGVLRVSQITR